MIHAAKLDNSPRLQRVMRVLEQCDEVSSWNLQQLARVCAPGTCAAELRAQGVPIQIRQEGRIWYYSLGEAQLELAV